MESAKLLGLLKIYGGVLLVQMGFSGFTIVAKLALNQGTSHYTFSVYRNGFAALAFAPFAFFLERKIRPKMTFPILFKIVLLGSLDPVIGQNLFYAGMTYSTATFTSVMGNVLPAATFVIAWILRIEKVDVKKLHSLAKVLGTLVTVGGAMIVTLFRGPVLGLPWTQEDHTHVSSSSSANDHVNLVKGALMIGTGLACYSLFFVVQAITLKTYPAGLSLTSLICIFGALEGTALTLAVERSNTSIWALGWNAQLLAYAYGGIISSGLTYYISGVIMKEKGPVFVTAFNPSNLVFTAIMSSFVFKEQLTVGLITGSIVIVAGLYLVIWGKSKDQKESMDLEIKPNDQELKPKTYASMRDHLKVPESSGEDAV